MNLALSQIPVRPSLHILLRASKGGEFPVIGGPSRTHSFFSSSFVSRLYCLAACERGWCAEATARRACWKASNFGQAQRSRGDEAFTPGTPWRQNAHKADLLEQAGGEPVNAPPGYGGGIPKASPTSAFV